MPYVAPFAIYMVLLGLAQWLPVSPAVFLPVRIIIVVTVLAVFSRRLVSFRAGSWLGSVAVGAGVFALWIAPDLLWPSYRSHWLFDNALVGSVRSTPLEAVQPGTILTAFRALNSVALVPVVEELFWRGWLMRWLVRPDFEAIPLGTYSHTSFWLTALLFAAEHGSYWDVGLLAGAAYNWWMLRTRGLADCTVAHAVTNGLLAGYVWHFRLWQYWP